MNREQIDREALIAAVETELPEIEHFLDLRSGEVLTVVKAAEAESADTGELDEIAADNRRLLQLVRAEPEAYERVPSIAPDAGFRWMQEFSSSMADQSLRAQLEDALRNCSDECFSTFRRCLTKAPEAERERWFAFRNEKIAEFIDAWLEGRLSEDRQVGD